MVAPPDGESVAADRRAEGASKGGRLPLRGPARHHAPVPLLALGDLVLLRGLAAARWIPPGGRVPWPPPSRGRAGPGTLGRRHPAGRGRVGREGREPDRPCLPPYRRAGLRPPGRPERASRAGTTTPPPLARPAPDRRIGTASLPRSTGKTTLARRLWGERGSVRVRPRRKEIHGDAPDTAVLASEGAALHPGDDCPAAPPGDATGFLSRGPPSRPTALRSRRRSPP